MTKRMYRSMQGKLVDMELLGQKHELAPAIGNIRVNARGDEIGPNGTIIRKREDIMAEYYENNPNAVRDENFTVHHRTPPSQSTASAQPTPAKVTETKKSTVKKEVKDDIQDDQTNS